MRLSVIKAQKESFDNSIQQLLPPTESDKSYYKFHIRRHEAFKRIIGRMVAKPLLFFLHFYNEQRYLIKIPFPYTNMCVGYRFVQDASLGRLLYFFKEPDSRKKVLIGGCERGGEDVQFWLRQGFEDVCGVDLVYDKRWDTEIIPALKKHYHRNVVFRQATLEKLPFKDNVFDLVTSNAVIEHIHNPKLAIKEIHRVMKPRSYSWHNFGPLYFSYSGDHCISTYGLEHGYDHLLRDNREYQQMIRDQAFFDAHAKDRLCIGWAILNQFSYYTAKEYIDLFQRYFEIVDLILTISPEGIIFRSMYPSQWSKLTASSLDDADLLISSISVILRKK